MRPRFIATYALIPIISEQFDPFNRAPLTPDMLQPVEELRGRIEEWKEVELKKSDHTH